jgi:heme/copper-type cytochrome/quinol oxidase subunit 3
MSTLPPHIVGTAPAAPLHRPRVLLIATALTSAGVTMVFASLFGVYIAERRAMIHEGHRWLPDKTSIPLTPGTMSLFTLLIAGFVIAWAVQAVGADDHKHAYLALGLFLLLCSSHIIEMGFLLSQTKLSVHTEQGLLIITLVGAHIALTAGSALFAAVVALRALGGSYSSRDREGVVAAALFFYVTFAVYAVLWYAVLVTK